jgi:hypothetical protein
MADILIKIDYCFSIIAGVLHMRQEVVFRKPLKESLFRQKFTKKLILS